MEKDPFADEQASPTIRWFWPADWDIGDDDPDAECRTGWFVKDSHGFWNGPFSTSQRAKDSQ